MIAPSSRLQLADAPEAGVAALALAGDLPAFEELVRRRQGPVRGLMRRLGADPQLADDLAQEAFLQAWRNIRSLRSASALGGWLRQIAVNVWLQHARRKRLPMEPLDAFEDLAAPEAAEGAALDLEKALARLSPAERLCLVLSLGEGMSHGEVAAATGWPLGTVKSHITRGARRLRQPEERR